MKCILTTYARSNFITNNMPYMFLFIYCGCFDNIKKQINKQVHCFDGYVQLTWFFSLAHWKFYSFFLGPKSLSPHKRKTTQHSIEQRNCKNEFSEVEKRALFWNIFYDAITCDNSNASIDAFYLANYINVCCAIRALLALNVPNEKYTHNLGGWCYLLNVCTVFGCIVKIFVRSNGNSCSAKLLIYWICIERPIQKSFTKELIIKCVAVASLKWKKKMVHVLDILNLVRLVKYWCWKKKNEKKKKLGRRKLFEVLIANVEWATNSRIYNVFFSPFLSIIYTLNISLKVWTFPGMHIHLFSIFMLYIPI